MNAVLQNASNRIATLLGDYPTVALVLQGGGALGSYQAGVVEGMAEAGIQPNWVAGISIGAINAAVIAGNPPGKRVQRLREFWEFICRQPWWPPALHHNLPGDLTPAEGPWRVWITQFEAMRALVEGQNGFFVPRIPFELLPWRVTPTTASYYDTRPLRDTLERFVDFDRVNRPGEMRVSVGAVHVRSGNFRYFDNTETRLGPEHFMASGALPPGFPAVEVEGELYWDGGLVSNTPLSQILRVEPSKNTLAFQVDLWSARGGIPQNLNEVASRQKDIQFSSRTRAVTDTLHEQLNYSRRIADLLALIPPGLRDDPAVKNAERLATHRRCNVVHLIYRNKPYEGESKDFEFGQLTLRDHWASGLQDIRNTLKHPESLKLPTAEHPFVTHDVHRSGAA